MVLDADTLQPGPFDPTSGNLRLIIFSTGAHNGSQVSVNAGGRALTFESVVASPNLPGLDELHVHVPPDLRGAGTVELVVRADGRDSNPVTVTLSGDSHRDIVINEFLADPPGGDASELGGDANHDGVRSAGNDEFVELVNNTTHDIDIGGYQILTRAGSGATDTVRHTFASGTILPGCTAIVVFGGGNPDASNAVFGGAQILKASSGSLSLSNTGGVVTLRDPAAAVENLVPYGGSTGLDGNANQSLTRSPDVTGGFTMHQSASGSGGAAFSPGTRTNDSPFSSCQAIARVDVSPSPAAIDEGEKQQFTAQAYDADNQPIPGIIFFWQSSNTVVATIDQNGLVTGTSAGSTEITAIGRGIQSAPATLTVRAGVPPLIVISQVYGGGGNSGATYKNDFIEIFNRGTTTVDFAGWSVQQASATGTTWSVTALCPSGSCLIGPGKYFLVLESSGGAVGADLPRPDASGTSNLAATSGKIALVKNTTPLNGSGCPFSTTVIDFVGYGTTADCFEGASHAPAPSAINSDLRLAGGCPDTNENSTDFATGTPNPRNTVSASNDCSAPPPTPTPSPSPSSSPSPSPGPSPAAMSPVVISEFRTRGPNGASDEFVEIYNNSDNIVDISGWKIKGSSSTGATITNKLTINSGTMLPAQGHLLVTNSAGYSGSVPGDQTYSSGIANDGGIAVTLPNDTVVDQVGMSTGSAFVEGMHLAPLSGDANQSYERRPGGASGSTQDTNNNFDDFQLLTPSDPQNLTSRPTTGGSPSPTPTPSPSPSPTPVSRVDVSPTNANINRGNTRQFTATALGQDNQPIVGTIFTWSSSNTDVATIDSSGLAKGVGIGTVTITGTTSNGAGGMVSGTATLNVQVPLVLNEILADPAGSATTDLAGDSNRDGVRDGDDDEFVEVLNNSSAAVDVSGVIVADSTSNRFTFPANTILAAGRAAVIFGGSSPPENDPAFGGALVEKTSSLSLNNGGDTVTVKLPVAGSNVVIATHTYGAEGGNDQSLTRSPDAEVDSTGGAFVLHSTATNAAGRGYSPGTRADGTPFGSPAITRIEITPASVAKDVGETQTFTARAFSSMGGPEIEVQNVCFIWDSSDTSKATVAPLTGQWTSVTAVASGSTVIHARAGGQQGTGSFTINSPPPILTSVTISPTSATVGVGDTQQFIGQALDQFGHPIGGVTVSFDSNNTTVVTLDSVSPTSGSGSATATVTGRASGSAEIRASATTGGTTLTSSPAALTIEPAAGQVLISEFRTRGPGGASDEFIEIYNPTTSTIVIGGLKIRSSSNTGATLTTRATINAGMTLGPGCHYLFAPTTFSGSGLVSPDQTSSSGIADDGGIAITRSDLVTIIDAVGMSGGSAYREGTTLTPLTGTSNQSYERKPGDALGNGVDTNSNANDFFLNSSTSNPQNLSSSCLNTSTADLSITKTASPGPIEVGSDVTYTLTVTNNGIGLSQDIVVTDDLPSSLTFVSCNSTGDGVCGGSGNARTVSFSSLAVGLSATITLVATVNGTGGTTISNTASVSAATTDPNSSNDSATFIKALSSADLTIIKTDSPDPVPSGNNVTYTVAVTNTGPDTAQNVVVTDNLPANVTLVSCDSTGGGVCGGTAGIPTVTFASLANGASASITLVATVTSSTGGGTTISNTATVTSDTFDPTTPNSVTQVTSINTIIINEALVASSTTNTTRPDFLELHNTTGRTQDISGLIISFRPGGAGNTPGSVTLPGAVGSNTTTVAANSYFIVVNGVSTLNGSNVPVLADYNPGVGMFDLNGTGGGIKIELGGLKLDGLTYKGSATAINATFVAYGEGASFSFTSATTNDLVRSSTSVDTNNNAGDFRHLSSSTTITPKAQNPP